jgi:hypothetical protein
LERPMKRTSAAATAVIPFLKSRPAKVENLQPTPSMAEKLPFERAPRAAPRVELHALAQQLQVLFLTRPTAAKLIVRWVELLTPRPPDLK